MQFIRTALWVMLAIALVAFIAINWTPVRVNVWPDSSDIGGFIHVQWPVGLIVLVSFFAGLLPMWLLSKAGRWRLKRRIGMLENSVRAAQPTPYHSAPHQPGIPPAESYPEN